MIENIWLNYGFIMGVLVVLVIFYAVISVAEAFAISRMEKFLGEMKLTQKYYDWKKQLKMTKKMLED